MQISTSLLALVASVSAASVPVPRAGTPQFNVTSLYIDSIAAAKSAGYNLEATFAGISTKCSVTVDTAALSQYCTSEAPFAPAIDGFGTRTCDDPAFSWSLTRNDALRGYSLQLSYTPAGGSVLTGCRAIVESDFACYSQGDEHAQDQEDYVGAHSFLLQATSTDECIYG